MAHQTAVAILAACLVAQAMAQTVAPKTSTAAPVCVLQATIDSKQSNVQISGDVTAPIPGSLKQLSPSAPAGTIYIVLPTGAGGKCPTAAELPTALKTAYAAAPAKGALPLTLTTPPKASIDVAGVGALANITVDKLQGAVQAVVGPKGELTFALIANDGQATVEAPLPIPTVSLKNRTLVGTGCALKSAGTKVSVVCDKLSLVYPFKEDAGGQSIEGKLVLSGKLLAVGDAAKGVVTPVASAPKKPTIATPPAVPAAKPAGRRLLLAA